MRVVLADDNLLFREGVTRVLESLGFDVVAQAGDGDGLLRAVAEHRPDVAITDIRMPPTHTTEGLETAAAIREQHPGTGVLVLSQYVETAHVVRLLSGGGQGIGYLLKDRVANLEDFGEAIRRVAHGGSAIDPDVVDRLVTRRITAGALDGLTGRERDVLGLMAEGLSNQAIGTRLFLGAKTIESHIRSIFMKLDLGPGEQDNRRVLAVIAYLRAIGTGAG